MRICFISLDYPSSRAGGGVGQQVRSLGRALVRKGHHVTVIALMAAGLEQFSEDQGVKVHRVSAGNLHWYTHKVPVVGSLFTLGLRELEYSWAVYRKARTLHKQKPFNLIEGTETASFYTALLMRDVPLVIRLHGEQYTFHKYTPALEMTAGLRLSRVVQRLAMRRARVLISPSRAHAREIDGELGAGHPPIVVIPNTSPPIALHSSFRATYAEGPVVLHAGRLEHVKGIPKLLEAARQVIDVIPAAQFVLAGGYHPNIPKETLEQLVAQFRLKGHVTFLGHVAWEELAGWYRRADVCVVSSYYETFGISALEAMSHGVPVVAMAAGGLPEVLAYGAGGRIVAVGDAGAMAAAIVDLLQNPQSQAMRRAMADETIRRFHIDKAASQTLALYNRVLPSLGREPTGTPRGDV